jgi:hypothetical protein
MIGSEPFQVRPSDEAQRIVHQLNGLAVDGLVQMFDFKKHLFCHKFKETERGLVREGVSRRYTMIALLGLHRLEASGVSSPIGISSVLDGLLIDTNWVDNIGDLGLLLWLCALVAPDRLAKIERRMEVETALDRFPDAIQGRTMELAWFLSGLSHGSLACPEKTSDLRELAVETYRRLRTNQGEQGIFGHVSRKESLAGLLRGRIGSFADQVYPIYAMTKFAQAYHVVKATERALDCALTLCQAQGPLGQWWWHYDCATGRVVERYPVYSVHQDGMAPMSLLALGEIIHSDFGPWISKGLQWVSGDNELDADMQDVSGSVVWRSIFRPPLRRYWNAATALLTQRDDQESRDGLMTQRECRPYHFGWFLYAFAGTGRQLLFRSVKTKQ